MSALLLLVFASGECAAQDSLRAVGEIPFPFRLVTENGLCSGTLPDDPGGEPHKAERYIEPGGSPPGAHLRGAMIATDASADDLRTLSSWGANHVRWQLFWDNRLDYLATPKEYRAWLDSTLAYVHAQLPLCDSLHLQVLIDLHSLPGGKGPSADGAHRILTDTSWQSVFRIVWKDIARRFRAAPAIWGYDLANEPVEGLPPAGGMDWNTLASATAADIRSLDTAHAIIVEAAPGGGADALTTLQPLHVRGNTVYSLHMYEPLAFTHQGIYNDDTGLHYPGIIHGVYWDKEMLRTFLQPVRDWQLRHHVPVYVGEFSAVRWAPDNSAYNYLLDCIALFEEWNWSWAYHAFREWPGWSVEHDDPRGDDQQAKTPTSREVLLRKAFGQNRMANGK